MAIKTERKYTGKKIKAKAAVPTSGILQNNRIRQLINIKKAIFTKNIEGAFFEINLIIEYAVVFVS
jgi:hypothetical protein